MAPRPPRPPRDRTALMLRGHAVLGLLASATLFAVSVTSHLLEPLIDPWTDPISNLAALALLVLTGAWTLGSLRAGHYLPLLGLLERLLVATMLLWTAAASVHLVALARRGRAASSAPSP